MIKVKIPYNINIINKITNSIIFIEDRCSTACKYYGGVSGCTLGNDISFIRGKRSNLCYLLTTSTNLLVKGDILNKLMAVNDSTCQFRCNYITFSGSCYLFKKALIGNEIYKRCEECKQFFNGSYI